MGNKELADQLATQLREGIVHPGNPEKDQPPFGVTLPMFRTGGGMPKEQADLMNATAQTLAEAVVHSIEAEHVIVDKTEYEQLQTQAAGMPSEASRVLVSCRCGTELMVISVSPDLKSTLDGRQLLTGLAKLNPKCPHRGVPENG